jgi:hypothetical protein
MNWIMRLLGMFDRGDRAAERIGRALEDMAEDLEGVRDALRARLRGSEAPIPALAGGARGERQRQRQEAQAGQGQGELRGGEGMLLSEVAVALEELAHLLQALRQGCKRGTPDYREWTDDVTRARDLLALLEVLERDHGIKDTRERR